MAMAGFAASEVLVVALTTKFTIPKAISPFKASNGKPIVINGTVIAVAAMILAEKAIARGKVQPVCE
jgi:hypothetical protein